MAREPNVGERLAKAESELQHVRDRNIELDAALKETVKEFRDALEKHRDFHETNAKLAAETKWKWVSAVLLLFSIAGPIATFVATQVLD